MFGSASPSDLMDDFRLPVSVPRSVWQTPVHLNENLQFVLKNCVACDVLTLFTTLDLVPRTSSLNIAAGRRDELKHDIKRGDRGGWKRLADEAVKKLQVKVKVVFI